MSKIERSIDVRVPASVAYNQWTQFESFPQFMEGVERVEQLDEKRLHWKTDIGGHVREFDAEISEQLPDKRIAWHSLAGARHGGVVTFHRLADDETRVMLQMEYEPEGVTEKVGDFVGAMEHRVSGDLKRFKEFIESRGTETGGYRGKIPAPDERSH